jgi:UDP-2,3-diacylglucosamine hydrolase
VTWLFLGDAHLNPYWKDGTWENFRKLVERPPSGLVLLGDFFDFWFGFWDAKKLHSLYEDLRETFLNLHKHGTRIIFLEGNHDFGLQGELFGVKVENYRWEGVLELEGLRVLLAHGDRSSGFPHFLPSLFLKNPFTCFLLRFLGPRVVLPVGFFWASRSKRRGPQEDLQKRLRVYALKRLREGFDAVIMAHTHMPDLVEDKGRFYFNVGSFRDGDYLIFSEGRFSLKKLQ